MAGRNETSEASFDIRGPVLSNELLWKHNTFLTGGPADLFARPFNDQDLRTLIARTNEMQIPRLILGGGSNVLIADNGVEGLVISTEFFRDFELKDNLAVLGGGLNVSEAAWQLGSMGYRSLDFLYGMPGTLGGAVWMNARCYGREIADCMEWAEIMNADGTVRRISGKNAGWAYKSSVFQGLECCILRASFRLREDDAGSIRRDMVEHRDDRHSKGHYRFPCAGSIFKNDRNFGAPSGAIIDNCGLKRRRMGGASVSWWHGNIFINDGAAKSADIRILIAEVQDAVRQQKGYYLQPELIMAGRWANAG